MKKISVIFDTVLTAAALFLLCAVIAGYFTRITSAVLLSCVTISVALTFFTGRLSERRKAPAKQQKYLSELLNKFLFSPREYALSYTLRAISNRTVPIENNGLVLAGNTAFAVMLVPEKITASALAASYASAAGIGAKKLVILSAYGAEPETASTAALLTEPSAEIWDFAKVYDFYSSLGCAPTQTMKLERKKKKLGDALKGFLRRENAKRYLFTSVVLLLWARFIPHSVFYVVIASVAAVLAVLCRLRSPGRAKR